MQEWLKVSIVVCVFGFLKEIRPSEPFIYEYLTGPSWWNKTSEEVQQDVFPIATYSQLVLLAVAFLITDLWRYKPLITILGASGVVVWCLLIWGTTLLDLQILEVLYGAYFAAEVAYFTYIYAKVPKEYYPQVTSHTRAALLLGHCVSGALSQTLVELDVMDYKQLNYISFGAMIAATLWSFLLPSVKTSIYFHTKIDDTLSEKPQKERYVYAFNLMKHHFVASFSKRYVIKWSIWWALSASGFIHVQAYMQPLWSTIHGNSTSSLHNGTVESVMTLVGFLGAISIGFLKIDWAKYGELAISVCSIFAGIVIIISSQAEVVIVSYACYVALGGLYYFVITIATSEVAKNILEDSYGLVFGLNTLVALIIQTLMVLVFVTGDLGWELSPRKQHFAYGLYHIGIALIFIINAGVRWIRQRISSNSPTEEKQIPESEKMNR